MYRDIGRERGDCHFPPSDFNSILWYQGVEHFAKKTRNIREIITFANKRVIKFAALHRQQWHFSMNEIFSNGTYNLYIYTLPLSPLVGRAFLFQEALSVATSSVKISYFK